MGLLGRMNQFLDKDLEKRVRRQQQFGNQQGSAAGIPHVCRVCGYQWADYVVNPQQCPNSYCGAALTDTGGRS